MTKTKIDISGVLILGIGTVCSTGLLAWMIYEWIVPTGDLGLTQRIFFTTLSGLITPLIWTIEIPKLKSVEIHRDRIVTQSLLTGINRKIWFTTIDGLKTTSNWIKGGRTYEIVIIVDGRPFHKISSNYIKNYDIIRAELKKRLTILDANDFESMRSVIKEKIRD